MPVRLIYLDQNKWIELARGAARSGDALGPVVEFVQAAKSTGVAKFPLSLAHYMETNKQHDPKRVRRLGQFMLEISSGVTLASPAAILRHEIENALAKAFQRRLSVRPFSLLGTGVGHTLDKPNIGFRIADPSAVLDSDTKRRLEAQAKSILEAAVLTGHTPCGPAPRARPDYSKVEDDFIRSFRDLRERLSGANDDLARRALYANVLVDILDPLKEAMQRNSITFDEFAKLGLEGWISLLEDMPSVRVNLHLRRHWLANPALRSKRTDQNDWYYLGAAVAYCDVVVTERHFAHVVNRGGLQKRASVITDLQGLPGA